MNNFQFYNPTKIYFGQDSLHNLQRELLKYGQTVLLAYGGGSIKVTGLYDQIVTILKQANKTIIEFSGIMPNPTAQKVVEGIKLAQEYDVDLILAVGGGSVIDCVKAVALGAKVEGDFWQEIFENNTVIEEAIPIATVLTMAATGSEMNCGFVITNEEKKIKAAAGSVAVFPQFSILNPVLTYSLPHYQLVSGIGDILSHIMEIYFSETDEDNVSDDLAEALFLSVVRNARVALKEPHNYVARSNIMWDATLALNGLIRCSKVQDWQVHEIEHQIAAYHQNITHGMGLTAISTNYYRFIYKYGLVKFKRFAINIWQINPQNKTDEEIALAGIDCLEQFFKEMGAATCLKDLGIKDNSQFLAVANSSGRSKSAYKTLTTADILTILEQSL